jgi:hypothetical protein
VALLQRLAPAAMGITKETMTDPFETPVLALRV